VKTFHLQNYIEVDFTASKPIFPPSLLDDLHWYSNICRDKYIGQADQKKSREVREMISARGNDFASLFLSTREETSDYLPPKPVAVLINSPAVDMIPWELTGLSQQSKTIPFPIFRLIDSPVLPPSPSETKIHLVITTPRPHGQSYLDHRAESGAALDAWESNLLADIAIPEFAGPTLASLIKTLEILKGNNSCQPIALHFDGHGMVDASGEVMLCFEDNRGQAELVTLRDFAHALKSFPISFVYLSSCRSGKPCEGVQVYSSAMQMSLALGCPVVAMAYAISAEMAIAFCYNFYRAIFSGANVLRAYLAARSTAALGCEKELIEWHVPMLYMTRHNLGLARGGETLVESANNNRSPEYENTITMTKGRHPACSSNSWMWTERLLASGRCTILLDGAFDIDYLTELSNAVKWLRRIGIGIRLVGEIPEYEEENPRLVHLHDRQLDLGQLRDIVTGIVTSSSANENAHVFLGAQHSAYGNLLKECFPDLFVIPVGIALERRNYQVPEDIDPEEFMEVCQRNHFGPQHMELAMKVVRDKSSIMASRWRVFLGLQPTDASRTRYIESVYAALEPEIQMLCARLCLISGTAQEQDVKDFLNTPVRPYCDMSSEELEDKFSSMFDPNFIRHNFTEKDSVVKPEVLHELTEHLRNTGLAIRAGVTATATAKQISEALEYLAQAGLILIRIITSSSSTFVHVMPEFRRWLATKYRTCLPFLEFAFIDSCLKSSARFLNAMDRTSWDKEISLSLIVLNYDAALQYCLEAMGEKSQEEWALPAACQLAYVATRLHGASGHLDRAKSLEKLFEKLFKRLSEQEPNHYVVKTIEGGRTQFPVLIEALNAAEEFRNGNYEKAKEIFEKIYVDVRKELMGTTNAGMLPQIVIMYANSLHATGNYKECLSLCEHEVLDVEISWTVSWEGALYNIKGMAFQSMGQGENALQAYESSVRKFQASGDVHQVSLSLTNLAACLCQEGKELEQAERLNRQAITLKHRLGVSGIQIGPQSNYQVMGQIALKKGDRKNAIHWFDEAADFSQSCEDHITQCRALAFATLTRLDEGYSLSSVHAAMDIISVLNSKLAVDSDTRRIINVLLERSLAILEQVLGDPDPEVAANLYAVAELYRAQGRYSEAEPLYQRSWAIRKQVLGEVDPLDADIPYALAQLYQAQGRYSEAEPMATVLHNLATSYRDKGGYEEAKSLYQRSLEIRERILGDFDPKVAESLYALADLYQSKGSYTAAEPLYQRSLTIRREVLGDKDPLVAAILYALPHLYQTQGRYTEAEPLYRQNLAILEQMIGKMDEALAPTLYALAKLCQAQHRYSEADPLYQRSLTIWEEALGNQHPTVANVLYSFASNYRSMGCYTQAESLCQRSLAIREGVLGSEHPLVEQSLSALGLIYGDQERHTEAQPLFERSLAIRQKTSSDVSPEMAESLHNLAWNYHAQGRHAQAEPLFRWSLSIREKILGDENPEVARTLHALATLYHDQGRYAEAEPLYDRGLNIRVKLFGNAHPEVAQTLHNKARLYHDQNRHAEAEILYQQSLEIRIKGMGNEDPKVRESLYALARLYHAQGNHGKAEGLYQQSIAMWKRDLGDEHPDVVESRLNLSRLYFSQGRYAEAITLIQEGVAIWERVLGREHPKVAENLNELAWIYQVQSRYRESEALFERCLEIREKEGNQSQIATALHNLAGNFHAQDYYAEAESLYQRSLAIQQKELGHEHFDVAKNLSALGAVYYAQGRYAEAEQVCKQSLVVAEKVLGDEDPQIAILLKNYAATLRQMDQVDKANQLAERAQFIESLYHSKEREN